MIRLLVILHRWFGMVLCLFFAMWFATGAVMMYVPFPYLSQSEVLQLSQRIDSSQLRSLAELVESTGLQTVDEIRIRSFDGRPLLIIGSRNKQLVAHFADTGERLAKINEIEAARIAEEFADNPARGVEGPIDYDQWVVHQQFDTNRPLYRVSMDDQAASQLYVSQSTGEVVQRTSREQRLWNYAGAVLHWIYPTVIRRDWQLWDRLVWWLALAGIVGALSGMVLGVQRLRRLGPDNQVGSPFAGWFKLHHVLGLFFGVFVSTWIFSGWLSMDHGRLFSVPYPSDQQVQHYQGISLMQALRGISDISLEVFDNAAEIDISAIDGKPLLVARNSEGTEAYVKGASEQLIPLPPTVVASAIASAWPDFAIVDQHAIHPTDVYGNLREGSLGPAVVRFVLNDVDETWIHVDMASGRIMSVMDRSRRSYRWFYNGLHSLDIPGLVERRPLWDVVMLCLLLGGFAFSVTAAVIAYRRLLLSIRRHVT